MAWYDDIMGQASDKVENVVAKSGASSGSDVGVFDVFKLMTDTYVKVEQAKNQNPAQSGVASVIQLTTTETSAEDDPNQRVANPAQYYAAHQPDSGAVIKNDLMNNDMFKIGAAIVAGLIIAKMVM